MPNEEMRALIQSRRKGGFHVVSDGAGKGRLVPVGTEPENAGDDIEAQRRVVNGGADGGKGREEPPQPTKMNQLIRDLAFGAAARTARQGG